MSRLFGSVTTLGAVLLASTAFAATYDASTGYVTQLNGGAYGDSPLYDDAMTTKAKTSVYYWSDHLGAHSGTNYYCTGCRGPLANSSSSKYENNTTNFVFKGDRLVLKPNGSITLKHFAPAKLTVSDFVLLGGSVLSYNEFPYGKPPSVIAGRLTIEGTASTPSVLNVANSSTAVGGANGQSIWLESDLVGASTACLKVGSFGVQTAQPNLCHGYLWLKGDTSGYNGTIKVVQTNELVLGASGLPNGSVVLTDNNVLSSRAASGANFSIKAVTADATSKIVLSPTNTLTVGTLALAAGAVIETPIVNGQVGSLRVTTACTFPLTLKATSDRTAVASTKFFSCPKSLRTLSESDFDFQYAVGGYTPTAKITIKEEGDDSVAYVTFNPIVHLVNGDPNTNKDYLSSAMTNALAWSDGQLPHAGADYIVAPTNSNGEIFKSDSTKAVCLRQPQINSPLSAYTPTTYTEFPGDSLTVGGGSESGDTLYLMHRELLVRDLRLATGSTLRFKDGQDSTIKGKITIYPNSNCTTESVRFMAYFGNRQIVESEIDGTGIILVKGDSGSLNSLGHVYLMNHNTNYTGNIVVSMGNSTRSDGKISPSIEQDRVTYLYVNHPDSLGGAMPSFTYDALVLEQMSVFSPLQEMTLADSTRGILVNGCGRFLVPEGTNLTITSTITHNGLMRKEGAGVLKLGSRPYFIDGKPTTAPLAGTNAVRVVAGSLEAISTNAFDGLAITFDAGSSWRVACSGDAELNRYGAVNRLGSFAPTTDGGRISVTFDMPQNRQSTSFCTAICTVKDAATAQALADVLVPVKPYRSAAVTVSCATNDDGTATVYVNVKPRGLCVICR